ncbi:Threonine/homoserine/homoserine lactone efflux protein [Streptoalloteichus tenebrarius]|uniref:Threonine/homoserine/homoserine lactone efflux protein n=1 Tax=Streptoalloteichus tenebrarius (strain ATCC 17920 / DSM 40477 / JCM 4838 / CBS 697.72 / NBRC 16177 / NCIMB 11028 / NRRL B-12390 / A12253. 1 / ISP 5477) TaxID=1933 RepID=A0ABT1I2K5_STRSD|nr:LysE family translocator [Streptoalloteichus tenebrarius]MCP2262018.1 Threonine/homoserine/homoserine lactone efflux protein [Streptoalloteichus tenebrarius]BFF02140.1 LysE family translocator [Streptoalloteichus tenebrarius]
MDLVTLPFLLTCLAIAVVPGPSVAVIIDQSLRAGRGAGLATIAGNTTGLLFWAVASVLGLTALLRTSEIAFVALKVVGAVYLCWLGVQSLRRSRRHEGDLPATAPTRTGGRLAAYRAGVLANLSNPKAAALYLALLPQFIPAQENVLHATAILAGVQMSISSLWYVVLVTVVAAVRRFLSRPVVRARIDQISGLFLVGLGVRMITLGRAAA